MFKENLHKNLEIYCWRLLLKNYKKAARALKLSELYLHEQWIVKEFSYINSVLKQSSDRPDPMTTPMRLS